MLLFGFVTFDEFATDPTGVRAVSETGFVLRRDAEGLVTHSRAQDWRLSREALQQLGGFIESERERTASHSSSTTPTMLVDVDGDDWESRIDAVVTHQLTNAYVAASAEEFVRRILPAAEPSPGTTAPSAPSTLNLADGRSYHPRTIRSMAAHMPTLLRGPAGSGKSTAVAAACGRNLEVVHCFDGMTREDLFGMLSPVPGQAAAFTYVDGPLPRAMLSGTPLLIDDANWMPPGIQALLLPVADDHRSVEIVDRSDDLVVRATPGFSLVLTENPGVGFGLIAPLRDRMAVVIDVDVDYDIAADQGVPLPLIEVAKARQARALESGDYTTWLPSIRELLHARASDDLFGLSFAAQALVGKCPADQRDDFIDELSQYVPVRGALVSKY
ncbi:AAA family ATPase [Gordonia alkanivorans]|uniref:AAA family ATPase n=1 Tax=Gordonia alkanivorans TaxID=84096 RepID=UPI0004B45527|nr:AAA family ATPase [Gordonia alkanivorans]